MQMLGHADQLQPEVSVRTLRVRTHCFRIVIVIQATAKELEFE